MIFDTIDNANKAEDVMKTTADATMDRQLMKLQVMKPQLHSLHSIDKDTVLFSNCIKRNNYKQTWTNDD
jgi:hypothetical protein